MFKDPIIQEKMDRDGFLVLELCSEFEVDALSAQLDTLGYGEYDGDLIFNKYFPNMESAYALQEILSGFFVPKLMPLLEDMSGMEGTLYYKLPGGAPTGFHQDWSNVDESMFRSWSVWMPLADAGPEGGTFKVIPGSHRLFPLHRSATLNWPLKSCNGLFEKYHQVIPIQKGQVIIFDHALIHGTTANLTSQKRTAAIMGLKPKTAKLIHYYWEPSLGNKLEVFELREYFMSLYDHSSRPWEEIGTKVKDIEYQEPVQEEIEVEKRIKQGVREAGAWLRKRKFRRKGIIY